MKPFRSLQSSCLACLGRWSKPGTRSWLVEREMRYGGYVTDLERHRISEQDSRTLNWNDRGMTGGDRMNPRRHNYGAIYARYLKPFLESQEPVTLAEVGILQGTGLALWSDLFPNGRVIGLDIDLTHFQSNLSRLIRSGAFQAQNHEVHTFDGFRENSKHLSDILQGATVDVVIDDASHHDESILTTFASFQQCLSKNFVYFVEDNREVYHALTRQYPQYCVEPYDEMTVLTDFGRPVASDQRQNPRKIHT